MDKDETLLKSFANKWVAEFEAKTGTKYPHYLLIFSEDEKKDSGITCGSTVMVGARYMIMNMLLTTIHDFMRDAPIMEKLNLLSLIGKTVLQLPIELDIRKVAKEPTNEQNNFMQ